MGASSGVAKEEIVNSKDDEEERIGEEGRVLDWNWNFGLLACDPFILLSRSSLL